MSLVSTITNNNDVYLISADFQAYIEAQKKVDETYLNKTKWTRMSILNAIRTGKFSSDRTIHEYAKHIWDIPQLKVSTFISGEPDTPIKKEQIMHGNSP